MILLMSPFPVRRGSVTGGCQYWLRASDGRLPMG